MKEQQLIEALRAVATAPGPLQVIAMQTLDMIARAIIRGEIVRAQG